MYICISVCIYTCIRIGIYVRVYICTHTHTHKKPLMKFGLVKLGEVWSNWLVLKY